MPSIETWVDFFQIGVGSVFLVLYIRGDIMSKSVVETILREAENRSLKLVRELRNEMKEATREGVLEAIHYLEKENGKK